MNIQYYTVAEAAELLRTTPNTIRGKIRVGKIPVYPFEGYPLIPKDLIDNWDINTKETFRERKLKLQLEEKDRIIYDLKQTIRRMVALGLESDLLV